MQKVQKAHRDGRSEAVTEIWWPYLQKGKKSLPDPFGVKIRAGRCEAINEIWEGG